MRFRRRTSGPAVADPADPGPHTAPLDDHPDLVGDTGAGRGRRGIVGLITLPFRVVGAVVRVFATVVRALIGLVMVPVTLAVLLVAKVVQWAADLTYAIWRVALGIVGAVLWVLRSVLRVINATVGGVLRLLFRLVRGALRTLLWVFTLGRLSGARKARKEAAAEAEAAATVIDVDDAA